MRPRPIDRLHLADNTFFKIEPPLPPPEDFGDCGFAFQGAVSRVPDHSVVQVNFAVAASRLKSETAVPLPQAAHLQNLGGGELIEISDQRVTGIDAFARSARRPLEGRNDRT